MDALVDPNVPYPVVDFLDDSRALWALAAKAGSHPAVRNEDAAQRERAHFAAKYGFASAPARMARYRFATELTIAFEPDLRAGGLMREDHGRVGTATAWLAFALSVPVPPDFDAPEARRKIGATVRAFLAERRGAPAPVPRGAAGQDPERRLPLHARALLDASRPPDPRTVAFLACSDLDALDPPAHAVLVFLSHRLDEATDADTRAYFAALLLDALRAVRPLAMGAIFGRRLEARLRELAPPAPPPSPFSGAEARMFISALDSAARDAYGSPSASAAREVVHAWVMRRRTQ